MIDNFFVYETPDFLDLAYVQQLVMRKLETDFVRQGYVRIDAMQDSYLSLVMKDFEFLGQWLNIYHTPKNGYIPLHIDGHRLAAFNIPIAGCDDTSKTIWYEPVTEWVKTYKPDERHYRVSGEMKKVFEFSLTRPALIRNDVAHDVKRANATGTRIIASWGCSGSFEDCRTKFKSRLENALGCI